MNNQNKNWKIRFINPRSPLSTITMPGIIQKMTFSRKSVFAPLNLTICAAVVPSNWQPEIVDENILEQPHTPQADVDAVGIGAMTSQAPRAYELADAYRRLGVKVILGGIHPSALPDEALTHADVVCRGDAEGTLPYALNDIAAGGQKQIYDWQEHPDAPIATPRKDLLNPKDYLAFNPIQTTRGCPHGCTFCTTPAIFGRKYRQRDIGDIVEEIRAAKEQFNSRVFIFSDDNVAGNQKWAMELFEAITPLKIRWASQCDILISRNDALLKAMRRSGCEGLIIGLESPKAGTLKEAGKRFISADEYIDRIHKIQSFGMSLWGSFIFGFDSDGWRDCMNAVRFAQHAKLCMSCYIILTPYPGTAVFDEFRRSGRLITEDWAKYNGSTVCFQPQKMTVNELRHAQMAAFYEFYRMPSAIKRLGFRPLKKNSWMANLAIQRGLDYYYSKKGRPTPSFSDFAAPDAQRRIERSLGLLRGL
ncbi:MAG TPA: radical SAM protein [Phycisphaerae bacterium]|nr:radical SAM protein [Phycisphaerae bacterium]HPS52667.1 radical SAM protein [Phycisphaerae bacterium]